MPAKDQFHEAVKNALIKDGWTITHDPLYLQLDQIDLYVDLGGTKVLGVEKNGQSIAVEVKSFIQPSRISEFHAALGQYLNYRLVLEVKKPGTILYLAIYEDIYNSFFQLLLPQMAIKRYEVNLLIYEPEKEEILEWKN